MTRHLITPSLHNSFSYFMSSETSEKQDLLNILNKVKEPPSEKMLAGIKLENDILAVCNGQGDPNWKPKYAQCVESIADIVRFGLWQERAMREVEIAGRTFLLYGKMDVVKRDWIYDIKYSEGYDVNKYQSSIQHPLYMYCSGIEKFAYLVSDGNSWWREDYFLTGSMIENMFAEIITMIDVIFSDPVLEQAYTANWGTYPDRKEAA